MSTTMQQPTVLITRPKLAAKRFATGLIGVKTLIAPVMEIVPVPADIPAAQGYVVTSMNAIRAVHQQGFETACPMYCIGENTTQLARSLGYNAQFCGENITELHLPKGDYLYLRGEHITQDLPLPDVVVYRQNALPLPPLALDLVRGEGRIIVPLFSARSTALLMVHPAPWARHDFVAISHKVAQTARDHGAQNITVCNAPTGDSMRKAVKSRVFILQNPPI